MHTWGIWGRIDETENIPEYDYGIIEMYCYVP